MQMRYCQSEVPPLKQDKSLKESRSFGISIFRITAPEMMRPRMKTAQRQRDNNSSGGSIQPPPFVPTVRASHKFRFTSDANNGVYNIDRASLLNLLVVATSATTTVRLVEGIRLREVEMWSNPTALGSPPSSLQIEWTGENAPSVVISDTSMGVRPAHVRSRPPARSSAQWWSMSGSQETDNLFQISVPQNSVIDLTVDLRFVEQESPTAGETPTGAALGHIYCDALDGVISGQLTPVGYNKLP